MTTAETLVRNFEEIRRKSKKLWSGIPPTYYSWRPDTKAMSFLEIIRHVLEIGYVYHVIIKNKGGHGDASTPWANRPYTNLEDELTFAEPFRKEFMEAILKFYETDFDSIQIVRPERITRTLSEFLLRCNYHEATHTGQLLSYLRMLGLDRPNIWD